MLARIVIHEYPEGCGYNAYITIDGIIWISASKRPFNKVEIENRLNRFLSENKDAEVKYTGGYANYEPSIPEEWWADNAKIL